MADHGINQIVERIEKRAEELARDVEDEVVVNVPASGEFDDYDVVLDAYDFKTALFVIQWAREQGGKNRPARPSTSNEITEVVCQRIIQLDATGMSQSDISHELNVNQARVNEVLKGKFS
jgi:hypothetical protein